jgi:hypothetical protein
MNLLDATVDGHTATVAGHASRSAAATGRCRQGADRRAPGIRAVHAGGDGLPVNVQRIEDVGRHQIVRATSPARRSTRSCPRAPPCPPAPTAPASIPPASTSMPTTGASRRSTPSAHPTERPSDMEKTQNNKAWFLVLPVLVLVAFSAVIPLMTVVNYSVQDTFGNNVFFWEGLGWFEQILNSSRMSTARCSGS